VQEQIEEYKDRIEDLQIEAKRCAEAGMISKAQDIEVEIDQLKEIVSDFEDIRMI
jgi:hypothetical protein